MWILWRSRMLTEGEWVERVLQVVVMVIQSWIIVVVHQSISLPSFLCLCLCRCRCRVEAGAIMIMLDVDAGTDADSAASFPAPG